MLPSPVVFAALAAAATWPSAAAGETVRREGLCLGPCAEPIHDVVQVRPGASYAAKVDCKNCPYLRQTTHGTELLHRDLALFFNISLSNDNHTVFVNGAPVFPALATIPRPPAIHAPQIDPNFSYANLSRALTCRNPSCAPNAPVDTRPGCAEWCHALQLGAISLDYLYTTNAAANEDDAAAHDSRSWVFALDAIAGHSYAYHDDSSWTLNQPSQKMLQVRVAGVEDYKNPPGSSNLFEPASPGESVYQLRIVDVQLVARSYQFPPKTPLTAWAKLSRFFGNDVWESEHRLLFISTEWGLYGKEGTLRNMFGNFVHWENWRAFWLIFASIIGGILAMFCAYKFFFWIRHQRELMKWDGINDVWDKLRRDREREEEEHSALLSARYRDDPSEGAGSLQRYTDDVDTMKPLPTKPLPEKPLPDVPLIDA